MADDQVIVPDAQTSTAPAGIPQEVHEAMQIALNGGFAPTPVESDKPTDVLPADAPPPFEFKFDVFKDKFQYEKPEDIVADIEALRAFKNAPPPQQTAADIEFENEESAKLFKAWQAGKEDEVYNYLAEKRQLETLTAQEVTEQNADQLIKLGMQIKFKDLGLSPAEIDHKFNKQYTVPKAPVQGTDELDEDFEVRKQNHQSQVSEIMMDKMIEAKIAKKELEAAKPKLVLPTIEETVDENYAQYLKALEDSKNVNQEAIEAYSKLTAKDIEKKMPFIDEANKIAFEFQYEPDAETTTEALAIAKDFNLFWDKFRNQDGTPDRKKFLSAIAFAINPEKALMEAMKQSKNATLKSGIPDNNQNNGGVIRQLPQDQGLSELDKEMKARGII